MLTVTKHYTHKQGLHLLYELYLEVTHLSLRNKLKAETYINLQNPILYVIHMESVLGRLSLIPAGEMGTIPFDRPDPPSLMELRTQAPLQCELNLLGCPCGAVLVKKE